jgi:hypothetical protein
MSVIEKALLGEESNEPARLTVDEAMVVVLFGAVLADGLVGIQEATRIDDIVAASPLRWRREAAETKVMGARAAALFAQEGTEKVLALCATTIPRELHATAFALAADLMLVDGQVGQWEHTYIDSLQNAFAIDDDVAMRIVEVLLIKNRTWRSNGHHV